MATKSLKSNSMSWKALRMLINIIQENENKKRWMKYHFTFPQEITDMIVDNFDLFSDKKTLNSLCKVSARWKHAALNKLYFRIHTEDVDEIIERPYLASYVKELELSESSCSNCYKFKNINFPNLKKMYFGHRKLCDNVRQFLYQNTSIQHFEPFRIAGQHILHILAFIMLVRTQAPNYQRLLSYRGPLNEDVASYLRKLGTQLIYARLINPENIVPSFAQFSDLKDIGLEILGNNDNTLVQALQYLNKFKSLSSFEFKRATGRFNQNVFTCLVENLLKPNAPALQKLEIHDIEGILKLPLEQHWPNLRKLQIKYAEVCPMNLIAFCEKAPNIQDIHINNIDEELMVQNTIDLPIKVIQTLKKLSYMEIYADARHYEANGSQIRYIRNQNLDETLRIEAGSPKSKFFEHKKNCIY